jgi:hypothetical protein
MKDSILDAGGNIVPPWDGQKLFEFMFTVQLYDNR